MSLYDLVNLTPSVLIPKFDDLLHLEVDAIAIAMERGRIPNQGKVMKLYLVNYLLSKDPSCLEDGLRQRLESYFKAVCEFNDASVITPSATLIPDITNKVLSSLTGDAQITTLDGNQLTLI